MENRKYQVLEGYKKEKEVQVIVDEILVRNYASMEERYLTAEKELESIKGELKSSKTFADNEYKRGLAEGELKGLKDGEKKAIDKFKQDIENVTGYTCNESIANSIRDYGDRRYHAGRNKGTPTLSKENSVLKSENESKSNEIVELKKLLEQANSKLDELNNKMDLLMSSNDEHYNKLVDILTSDKSVTEKLEQIADEVTEKKEKSSGKKGRRLTKEETLTVCKRIFELSSTCNSDAEIASLLLDEKFVGFDNITQSTASLKVWQYKQKSEYKALEDERLNK